MDESVVGRTSKGTSGRKKLRALLIGPIPPAAPSTKNPVGGAAVNFSEMVRHLSARGFVVSLVDTTRPRVNMKRNERLWTDTGAVVRILLGTAKSLKKIDVVVLNIAAGSAWSLGAALWILCRTARKRLVIRFFGGDFASRYGGYNVVMRWWSNCTFMRSDAVMVQTKRQLSRFNEFPNFRWFSNTRDVHRMTARRYNGVSKLLFVSQIRIEKGIREALEACRHLPDYCEFNIYGPLMPKANLELVRDHPIARYRGTLEPIEVPEVISRHDVLLLPTYWESEGYPGVILEALQCGVPVVSTWWESIPEVVEHERSGLLVEPRSWIAVKAAIDRMRNDTELYERLCRGAASRGECFRGDIWYDQMAALMWSLCRDRGPIYRK